MKFLCNFSRILLGVVFIFSGLTKLIDPVGFGFVISDYLNALGLSFLTPLSLITGVLQSALEFVIGVALLVGLQLFLSSIFVMVYMVFFTFFTLWTAIFNPVQHCGCFGDAIVLTNVETFLKNLVFTPFAILLFIQRKRFKPISFQIKEWTALILFGFAALLLALYCYRHLPLIDFTGFKVGSNIPENRTIPDDAPQPVYETILTYQKGSKTKKFTIDQLPDSSWTFVSQKTKLIHAGATPQITNFDISYHHNNKYVTDSLLSIKGWLWVLTIPHTDKARIKDFEKVAALYQPSGIPFIVISGSGEGATATLLDQFGITSPFFFSDPKSVYTMVRTNPGLMLLYDATVVAKWSGLDIPSQWTVQKILDQDWEVVSAKHRINERLTLEFLTAFLLLLLGGAHLFFRRFPKYREVNHVVEEP